jgi:simple sugar transport system substrate-binding protein
MNKFAKILLLFVVVVSSLVGLTAARAQDKPLNITFVTHDLGAGVFAPVRLGMEDACKMIGAQCEFLGPQQYDLAGQIAIIEAAIAKKPDAIVTTRVDPAAYDAALKKAQEAGIMLVTFNTNHPDADKKLPIPFVGQNFTNYGVVWAHEVMRVMPDGGDMAITDCCFGHFALEERNRSFKETLEKEGQGKWKVLDIINTGSDETKVYGAIEAYYQAHQNIKAIWGVDYYSHVIANFVKKNKLQGKLLTGGSDMGPGNIEGIKEGYVAFGLGQNPYMQGFYPVMLIWQAKKYGIRPVTIDTGTDVVTPQNFSEYNPKYR